jgi:hypothetical protein
MVYYNTTTEPTLLPGENFFTTTIPFVFTLGSMIGACIVFSLELFLYKNRISFQEESSDEEETSDDDSDELEEYLTQYDEEYEALPEKSLNDEDMVREMTPFGEVVMMYNRKAEAYSYYTDVMTELSFEVLETVAKKYNISRGGCAPEPPLAESGDINASTSTGSTSTGSTSTPTGGSGGAPPFAKFKSYNTGGRGASPNYAAASPPDINRATQHFRYKGKLADYELEQTRSKNSGSPTMDYATFKKLMEITDKMKGI